MSQETFTITAHRGAMSVEPENTMRSFRRAAALGVDAMELDVHLSRDGHLVVMHDKTLDRTTNGSGAIADTDFETIRGLDAGRGEQVPEFSEVWSAFPEIGLQVEVKDAKATDAVLDLIRSQPRSGPTIITSFLPDVVARAVAEDGPWTVGLIGGKDQEDKMTEYAECGVDHLMVHWSLADLPAIKSFRASGRPADVWPCRTREDVRKAIDDGWSGLTADDPEMAMTVRAERIGADMG